MQIGARIRELRTSKGLSGKRLAAIAGISQSFLSHIEHGNTGINLETVQSIANALEVHISNLFLPEPRLEPEPEHQLNLLKEGKEKLDSVSKKILLTLQDLTLEQKKDLLKQAEKDKLINRLLKSKKQNR